MHGATALVVVVVAMLPQYSKVPQQGETIVADFVRNHRAKLCCAPLCLMLVLLPLMPCTPLLYFARDQAKQVILAEGSTFTGLPFKVDDVCLGFSQADVTGMEIGNPAGFPASPYFMSLDHVHVEVNMMQLLLSSLRVVDINDITMQKMTVFAQQQLGSPGSNDIVLGHVRAVLASITAGHGNWAEKFMGDKQRKYMIRNLRVQEMRVGVFVNEMPVKDIKVPPQVVRDLGVEQQGVTFEELVNLVVHSLSVVSIEAATGTKITTGPDSIQIKIGR